MKTTSDSKSMSHVTMQKIDRRMKVLKDYEEAQKRALLDRGVSTNWVEVAEHKSAIDGLRADLDCELDLLEGVKQLAQAVKAVRGLNMTVGQLLETVRLMTSPENLSHLEGLVDHLVNPFEGHEQMGGGRRCTDVAAWSLGWDTFGSAASVNVGVRHGRYMYAVVLDQFGALAKNGTPDPDRRFLVGWDESKDDYEVITELSEDEWNRLFEGKKL